MIESESGNKRQQLKQGTQANLDEFLFKLLLIACSRGVIISSLTLNAIVKEFTEDSLTLNAILKELTARSTWGTFALRGLRHLMKEMVHC